MGLEIGPAPERSRSSTSWTSTISYEARWPRVGSRPMPCQKCVEMWPKWRFWRMKRCICHHWIPPTECYVLGAPRIRWGGVREALGGGVMLSVCSRKPPYKIHEDLRDSTGKGSEKIWKYKMTKIIRCNDRIDGLLLVLWVGSIRDHFWKFQLKTNSDPKGSRKIPSWRWWTGGESDGSLQDPLRPPFQFRYPHCAPILMPMVLDSSHNLRMIHEGRTIVTILV